MYQRITLVFRGNEIEALAKLAEREYRDTRTMGVLIIREELERRGLLTSAQSTPKETKPNR